MDSLFLIVMIGMVLYFLLRKRPNNRPSSDLQANMTDTQRNWHDYKQAQDSPVLKQNEMLSYIGRNKRPFRVTEWIVSTVDSRFLYEYIKNMAILLFLVIGIPIFFNAPIFPESVLFCVIVIDWLMYHKQLLYEVTEWNPEFYEKFLKR